MHRIVVISWVQNCKTGRQVDELNDYFAVNSLEISLKLFIDFSHLLTRNTFSVRARSFFTSGTYSSDKACFGAAEKRMFQPFTTDCPDAGPGSIHPIPGKLTGAKEYILLVYYFIYKFHKQNTINAGECAA
jgi:hypothetical protein